jgi:hypothetical protein
VVHYRKERDGKKRKQGSDYAKDDERRFPVTEGEETEPSSDDNDPK